MILSPPLRVLIAKPGLDGHDRGARVVVRGLREAGMDVIYTGLRQTPEMIVETALREDVDCLGISILSGAHNVLVCRVLQLLPPRHAGNPLVVVGGTIPPHDVCALKAAGVAEIFGPGATLAEIASYIRSHAPARALTLY